MSQLVSGQGVHMMQEKLVMQNLVCNIENIVHRNLSYRVNRFRQGQVRINFSQQMTNNQLPFRLNWTVSDYVNNQIYLQLRPEYLQLQGVSLKIDNNSMTMDFLKLINALNTKQSFWTTLLTPNNQILLKHSLNAQSFLNKSAKEWWNKLRESAIVLFQKLLIFIRPFTEIPIPEAVFQNKMTVESSRTNQQMALKIYSDMIRLDVLNEMKNRIQNLKKGKNINEIQELMELGSKKRKYFENSKQCAIQKHADTLKILGMTPSLLCKRNQNPMMGKEEACEVFQSNLPEIPLRNKKNVQGVKFLRDMLGQKVIDPGDETHCTIRIGLFELVLLKSLYLQTNSFLQNMAKEASKQEQKKMRMELVVKTPDNKSAPSIVKSFKNEIRFLTFIRNISGCESIASFYLEQVDQPSQRWTNKKTFLMDFYPYTLDQYLEKNAGSLLDRLRILQEVAQGLNWLVNNGICHRDIKPQNIMLDLKGKVKIIDFGGCCPNSKTQMNQKGFRAQTNLFLGTAPYYGDFYEYSQLPINNKYSKSTYREHQLFDVYSFGKIMEEVLDKYVAKMRSVGNFLKVMWSRCTSLIPEDRPNFSELSFMLGQIIDHYTADSMMLTQ